MRVSCIQMDMLLGKEDYNFKHAQDLIRATVAQEHPDVVVLPETWNVGFFPKEDLVSHCDQDGTRIKKEIGGLAKELNTNIVAGSIGNVKGGKVYNTAFVFDREGNCVYQYDKIHLFGFATERESYDESASICGGDDVVTFDAPFGKVGLSVCYDLRFPELYRAFGECTLIVVPAAFTYTTGKVHWEVLLRARAIENQAYVLAAAQGGRHITGRRTWGHTMLIDPWGEVKAVLPEGEGVIAGELDVDLLASIREKLPALKHRKL